MSPLVAMGLAAAVVAAGACILRTAAEAAHVYGEATLRRGGTRVGTARPIGHGEARSSVPIRATILRGRMALLRIATAMKSAAGVVAEVVAEVAATMATTSRVVMEGMAAADPLLPLLRMRTKGQAPDKVRGTLAVAVIAVVITAGLRPVSTAGVWRLLPRGTVGGLGPTAAMDSGEALAPVHMRPSTGFPASAPALTLQV
jgi:hypothetical protein